LRASVGGRDALRCHGRSHGSRPGRHRRWPSPGSLVYGRAVRRDVVEPRALHPENRVARGEREHPRDAEQGSFRHQNRPSSTIVLRSGPPRTPALRERMTAPARDGELSELLFTIQSVAAPASATPPTMNPAVATFPKVNALSRRSTPSWSQRFSSE